MRVAIGAGSRGPWAGAWPRRISPMTRSAIAAGIALSAGLMVQPASAESRVGVQILVAHDPQGYGGDRYGYGYAYYGAYRSGYARGYEDGFDHGKDDAGDRDGYNFWHSKEYRKADHGYHDHYGSRWDYQRGYRGGYEVGYRRAYTHFQSRHDHGRCDSRYGLHDAPGSDDRDRGRYPQDDLSRYPQDDGRYYDREEWRDLYDRDHP